MLQHNNLAQVISKANKASVNFHTDHSKGSLAKVLTKIAEADINLSKLQSFPIPGSNFKYSFHADLEFENMAQFELVIEKMKQITAYLKIYGVYKNGKLK
jgi:prephenate dehydratase